MPPAPTAPTDTGVGDMAAGDVAAPAPNPWAPKADSQPPPPAGAPQPTAPPGGAAPPPGQTTAPATTPTGSPDPAQAQPAWAASPSHQAAHPNVPQAGTTGWAVPGHGQAATPPLDVATPDSPGKRPRWLLPLIGLVALMIAAVIAVSIVSGRSGSGTGASDPETALNQFISSLETGDLLGTAEVLNPDETRPFIRMAENTGDLPSRIGFEKFIPDDDSDVSFDVRRNDVDLSVDQISDDVAKVELTGGEFVVQGTTTDSDLDIRSLLFLPLEVVGESVVDSELDLLVPADEVIEPVDEPEVPGDPDAVVYQVDEWAESLGHDPFMMAIRRNGRWYLSPAYTIAEYLRLDDRGRRADFDAPGEATGAASPEEAVERMLDELVRGDLEDSLGLIDPTGLAVVHAYADSLFDAEVRDDFRLNTLDADIDVDRFEVTTTELGNDLHKVVIADFVIDTDDDRGDRQRFSFDGGCLVRETTEGSSESCLGELANDATTPQELALARIAPRNLFVVVREHDGGFFIDPLETVAQYLIEGANDLDSEVLEGFGITEPQRTELDEVSSGMLGSSLEVDRYVSETDSLPIAVRVKNTSTDGSDLTVNVMVEGRIESDTVPPGGQIARATLDPTALGVVEVRARSNNAIDEALDASYEVSFVAIPDDAELVPDGAAEGTLAENEVRLLDVNLDNGDLLNLDLEDSSLVVYQPSRFSVTGFGSGTSFNDGSGNYQVFADGLHRVVIVGNSDSATYELGLNRLEEVPPIEAPPPVPIEVPGTDPVELPAEGVAATYDLAQNQELTFWLPAGPVEVTVIPTPGSEDLDLVLEFEPDPFDDFPDTSPLTVDTNFAGEPETISVEVDPEMSSQVRVRGFLGGGGNFEISWQAR